MCENMFVYELEGRGKWTESMCQKVREKFRTMAFEYYRANMHRHVACANVLVAFNRRGQLLFEHQRKTAR